jgi:hypothetical protein
LPLVYIIDRLSSIVKRELQGKRSLSRG